jgi:predicted transposase YbfD/YdcC
MAKRSKILKELSEIVIDREILEVEKLDVRVLHELRDEVSEISDVRDPSYVWHKLSDIIMIVLLAVLAGANEWGEIEVFGQEKHTWLRRFLELRNGVPTDDTYRIVISSINLHYLYELLKSFFVKKIEQIIKIYEKDDEEKDIIACDGKVSKGSKRQKITGETRPLNTLSAYSVNKEVCLNQEFIEEKTNEITAMPKLLKRIDLKNAIVTCDALNTQTKVVKTVVEQGGDYVMALKANHKTLFADIVDYFDEETTKEIIEKSEKPEVKDEDKSYKKTKEKEHSAVVTREYFLEKDIEWLYEKGDWAGLNAIGLERKTTQKLNVEGAQSHVEHRYYLSSISDISNFSRAVRSHWGVENSLHWHLDFTFKDDNNTTTKENGAQGLQVFKKIALVALKFAQAVYPKRTSIKNIRYRLGLSFEKEIEKIFTVLNVQNFFNVLEKKDNVA